MGCEMTSWMRKKVNNEISIWTHADKTGDDEYISLSDRQTYFGVDFGVDFKASFIQSIYN